MPRIPICFAALAVACSGDVSSTADAPVAVDAVVLVDAPPVVTDAPALARPAACPTTGKGAVVVTGGSCVVFTPAMTGAAPQGVNAGVPSYALAPSTGAAGNLVVFMNGSGGSPAGVAVDPAKNVYTAAVAAGDHVIGLSYRSNDVIGELCAGDDGCFLPTRTTIVTGIYQTGAASFVSDVMPSEGIHERLARALAYLAAVDPGGGWGAFLDGAAVRWDKIIAGGHSQGGGHAALLGKLHPLARIVGLSSPCDSVARAAATWLHADATWQTSPAERGYGFSAATTFDSQGAPTGGDTLCPAHAAVWTAMGIDTTRRFDDAVVCGTSAHGASIGCPENFARLVSLFQL